MPCSECSGFYFRVARNNAINQPTPVIKNIVVANRIAIVVGLSFFVWHARYHGAKIIAMTIIVATTYFNIGSIVAQSGIIVLIQNGGGCFQPCPRTFAPIIYHTLQNLQVLLQSELIGYILPCDRCVT